jgi:hypothetical protein
MNRLSIVILFVLLGAAPAAALQPGGTPSDTVIKFYRALKQKRYIEGFRHSIYRGAVEGLSPAELKNLEPDFAKTFSAIPDKIEPRGERITGDTATVMLKFEGMENTQDVALVRVGGEWLVGDQDALAVVRAQGHAFFFNSRILVNEAEIFELLQQLIGAQVIYARKYEGRYATLKELIRLEGVPKDIEDEKGGGYKFVMTLGKDQKSFYATATPVVYGRSGRTSFYADANGIRGEDLKGRTASPASPTYVPK